MPPRSVSPAPAGRQWVLDQLTRLIDTVQPDYLKWDNNLWVNCDRPGTATARAMATSRT